MAISKEKIEKIKSLNTDNSDFILRINEYINYEYEYSDNKAVVSNVNDFKFEEQSLCLLFSLDDIEITGVRTTKIENLECKEKNMEEAYYAGNKYLKKVKFYKDFARKFDKSIFKNLENTSVVFDISGISSYPLWNTIMRRRINNIIEKIEKAEIDEITSDFIDKIVENSERIEIKFENKYDIDFIIEFLKEISKVTKIEAYFIDNLQTNETKFMVNELQKFIHTLQLAKDERYDYIYDAVCANQDEMFSKFGFCNFKEDKCVAQRHKNFFNRYPVPETDGCCFKVVRKCEHNNRDGTCKIKCLPCKLFTCPYLGKLDMGVRTSELILMRSFFNNRQKRISIHKFYTSKEILLKKIKEQE